MCISGEKTKTLFKGLSLALHDEVYELVRQAFGLDEIAVVADRVTIMAMQIAAVVTAVMAILCLPAKFTGALMTFLILFMIFSFIGSVLT